MIRKAQPDHPGLGQLLPDTGSGRDLRQARPTTCGGSPTSGPGSATRTSRRPGSSPGTSASSTRPGKTGGCSATATAAPTCTASPGPASSDTRPSGKGRPPTTPRWPSTGPDEDSRPPLPINNTSLWLTQAQDGCCPICKTPLSADDQPQTPSDWATLADRHPHNDHDRQAGTGTSDEAEPPSRTRPLQRPGRHFCPPTSHQGLLEPDAGKLARPVLRGTGHSNAPGPIRQRQQAWRRRAGDRATRPLFVHLSSLVERHSRVSSIENAEVELEHDQLELRSRIAWLSERLAAGAALTAQIRPTRHRRHRRAVRSHCLAKELRRLDGAVWLRLGEPASEHRPTDSNIRTSASAER